MTRGLFDLTGKVALVTGGNGGIGLGMARRLALHGASVIIWGNKPEKNEDAAAELRQFGGEVRCRQVISKLMVSRAHGASPLVTSSERAMTVAGLPYSTRWTGDRFVQASHRNNPCQ